MEISQNSPAPSKTTWLDLTIFRSPVISLEKLLFAIILIVAIFTRFYMLEPRVMSHDETSHTYFSWLYYKGEGYTHDPVTHGPFQFHIVALSYFLFGDSDTTARIPAALFGIATVAFMWAYRRYLGRAGALIAAILFTISPYMLYYSRYVRNESFVAFFGVVMIWATLRFIDTGQNKFLYVLTTATVMQFVTKETSYIYSAQILLVLGIYFVYRLLKREWKRDDYRFTAIITLVISMLLLGGGALVKMLSSSVTAASQPKYPFFSSLPPLLATILLILGVLGVGITFYLGIVGFGWNRIRQERSFDLQMLLWTLILPQLSAFGIKAFGWTIPVNATEVRALTTTDIVHMAIVVVPIFILTTILGLWWNRRQWLINAGIWYVIYITLYTSMFTNGAGFFTGLVGSLGYWLAQQGVNRGDQPLYYYALIQIPMYEYLPAIGSVIGIILAIMGRKTVPDAIFVEAYPVDQEAKVAQQYAPEPDSNDDEPSLETVDANDVEASTEKVNSHSDEEAPPIETAPTVGMLIFWVISSLLAYTVAGEKMPWLTVHITLGMILLSGWAVGYLIDTTNWAEFRSKKGWLVIALLFVFIPAFASTIRILLGTNPPFAGKTLEQLSATSGFVIALIMTVATAIGLYFVARAWAPVLVRRCFAFVFLGLLAVLTARAAFMASYINYDLAKEYLVYAHCAPGDKIALQQITDISRRLTGGLEITVAYDDKTTYPYWWYLRNFPNQRYYGANPTRDLRDVPLILVGQDNYGKIEPIVGQAYDMFEYNRIWWPNMDYFNLTKDRILYAITSPEMREAIFQVWLNRDYKLYGQLTGQQISLQNWNPAEKFRLYIRKDVVNQLWDYGSTSTTAPIQADPYEGKQIAISADRQIGNAGSAPGQFQNPRDLALAPDGTLYIADSFNNRIQHLAADGSVLKVWGTFADISKGDAPGGTFYEPWGIAVGPDGSVYVADTWNHRIQKFSADGQFIKMWGTFGQAETPLALWGPRDIAVDKNGNLFVTDTGNKRIVEYDADGNYISQFGSVGSEPGQFDEPVGVAVDKEGVVYVADTWNQRIQVMAPNPSGGYSPLTNWDIYGWFGQSLDNKPFIAVDDNGNLYVTDPEGYRVLHFTTTGTFVNYFGDFGTGMNQFNLPTGIITDGKGGVWIADAGNNRIMHFTLPSQ